MNEIELYSYAKINLSIDVGKRMENGMHPVDMIMQQIDFKDDVSVRYEPDSSKGKGSFHIDLICNRPYLPTDERNLAYKAAALMGERYGENTDSGRIQINIRKRIPVAAGLAGGSGNAAAVLHGLNVLWGGRDGLISLRELLTTGAELGSDVPFCIAGQARACRRLPAALRRDPAAGCCARATGTGTELRMIRGLKSWVVIARPEISVSTATVYRGFDSCEPEERPDNDALEEALRTGNRRGIQDQMINVLESYTLKAYPQVAALKERIGALDSGLCAGKVMMSGSGPTIFALFDRKEQAKGLWTDLRALGYEAYWTKTMV